MNTHIVMSSNSRRTIEAYHVHANTVEEALAWAQAQDNNLRATGAAFDAILGLPARSVERPHLWVKDHPEVALPSQKKESEAS